MLCHISFSFLTSYGLAILSNKHARNLTGHEDGRTEEAADWLTWREDGSLVIRLQSFLSSIGLELRS